MDDPIERLHRSERARIERCVSHRTGDPELAADVVSEAFLRLHRQTLGGTPPDQPAAWLTRVALNLAMSEGRHRQVVNRLQGSLPQPRAEATPDEVVSGRELARRLGGAIAALDPVDRDLVLAAAAGATGASMASATGRSEVGVRTRLHRARRQLRMALADMS
jgi:RNA polymerase sigma-70 factor (ECF subfamily)